jgi:hypothetical protein
LRAPRQYSLVLLKVGWREGKALGSGGGIDEKLTVLVSVKWKEVEQGVTEFYLDF